MSAYRHLKQVSISSASSSVRITDVFDNQYDIYKVTALYDNSAGNVVKTQMIAASGATIFSSNYDWVVMQNRPGGTYQEQASQNNDNWRMSYEGTEGFFMVSHIFDPFSSTNNTQYTSQQSGYYGGAGVGHLNTHGAGTLTETTSCTGIHFRTVGSNFDSFVCNVYGLRED